MKITLRKVKSGALGEEFNPNFFTPVELPHNRSAVSISVIGNAFSICNKYGLDANEYIDADYSIYEKRKVVEVRKKISFIFVPSTQSSNSNSIKKYCERICELIEFKDYLHLTHFGYLKTSFPSAQIKKILSIFLEKVNFECEVCWDIDEKFINEMQELLAECLTEKNEDINFDSYDTEAFVWSKNYDTWRENRSDARNERRLEHNRRISEEYQRSSDAYYKATSRFINNSQTRGNRVVTRHINELPNIGAVAAGNAGEYYALSLFIRMGFVAGKAPEGTATYDLLVMTKDSFSFNPVQVKTITNGQHWLMRQRHEEVVDKLIFCFVKLTDTFTIPKVFLVPADVVSYVIRMCHEIYLALPNQEGGQHADTSMRTLKIDFSTLIANVDNPEQYLNRNQLSFIQNHSFGWLDEYENNFDIFKTQD
jgi:hypothetical protein